MARKSRYETIAQIGTALSGAAFTAGLYLRLSVEDGDDLENNSIGNQRKIGLDFLRGRTDIALGGIYIDNGRTGMNFKRSGFQSMLSDLEDGKINCVIVKDVSRLGRHYVMTSEYVEKVFPTMGVRLICINDPYDSADPRADRDSLLMPFKLIMNDTYVKDTARKIQSSINAKMRNGVFLPAAGSIPYGYLRNPEEITYAVDPEAAAVVGRIFEMRAAGMMFNAIAKQLNEEGIPSPGKLRYERGATRVETYKDALWLRGTIRKITGDMVYTGCRIHGKIKRERLGGDKKRRPPEDWQILENAHPAIVSKELFEKVQAFNQAELARRGAFEKRDGSGLDFRGIFAGKVFCGDCSARMSVGKRVQRAASSLPNTFFFDCNSYRSSNHQRCASHYIGQETPDEFAAASAGQAGRKRGGCGALAERSPQDAGSKLRQSGRLAFEPAKPPVPLGGKAGAAFRGCDRRRAEPGGISVSQDGICGGTSPYRDPGERGGAAAGGAPKDTGDYGSLAEGHSGLLPGSRH